MSSHLDRTSLVSRGFIIWLPGKFFLRETADTPELEDSAILPAHGAKCVLMIEHITRLIVPWI